MICWFMAGLWLETLLPSLEKAQDPSAAAQTPADPASDRGEGGEETNLKVLLLSDFRHLARGRSLILFDDLELDLFALAQGTKSFRLNRGVVHETIASAIVRSEEAEPLGFVEPFDGTKLTLCHFVLECRIAVRLNQMKTGPGHMPGPDYRSLDCVPDAAPALSASSKERYPWGCRVSNGPGEDTNQETVNGVLGRL